MMSARFAFPVCLMNTPALGILLQGENADKSSSEQVEIGDRVLVENRNARSELEASGEDVPVDVSSPKVSDDDDEVLPFIVIHIQTKFYIVLSL